jgi:hypothetical protein
LPVRTARADALNRLKRNSCEVNDRGIRHRPRVFINDSLAGTKHEPGFSFGKISLKNAELKELTCENFAASASWNEVKEGTERGFGETTEYSTWECKAALPCEVTNENGVKKEGVFASADRCPTPP